MCTLPIHCLVLRRTFAVVRQTDSNHDPVKSRVKVPMDEKLPVIHLARHGETAWTLTGQHTGRTDLPLTEQGEREARSLGERLRGHSFAVVLTSPLQRASRTCELAGFREISEIDADLVEWDYGSYEGRRTVDIHTEN